MVSKDIAHSFNSRTLWQIDLKTGNQGEVSIPHADDVQTIAWLPFHHCFLVRRAQASGVG